MLETDTTPAAPQGGAPERRLTIGDIAAMAGVGKATVSRVINNSGYVSAGTRARVEKVLAETVFLPSAAARSLSRRESDTVGVIIPEADNAFFWGLLKGMGAVADAGNLSLILCSSANSMEKDLRSFQAMRRQRVRGVVFTPATAYNSAGDLALLREHIDKLETPVVLLDRPVDGLGLDGVYTDNYAGAHSAAEVLIGAGHKSIGIVAGDPSLRIARERFNGFADALREHGLALDPRHVVKGMFDIETAYRETAELLRKPRDVPDAFFAANNLCAIGFLQALSERGLSTPGDVGFICFDHLGEVSRLWPGLSHLDRDAVGMGAEAMRLLLAKREPGGGGQGDIIFPSKVVLLGSEKRAAAGWTGSLEVFCPGPGKAGSEEARA